MLPLAVLLLAGLSGYGHAQTLDSGSGDNGGAVNASSCNSLAMEVTECFVAEPTRSAVQYPELNRTYDRAEDLNPLFRISWSVLHRHEPLATLQIMLQARTPGWLALGLLSESSSEGSVRLCELSDLGGLLRTDACHVLSTWASSLRDTSSLDEPTSRKLSARAPGADSIARRARTVSPTPATPTLAC